MTRPEKNERALIASERIYKALLMAYPKEFRSEYGPQMAQAFRDLCREELGRGGTAGLARLWVHTLLDLVATALAERSSGRASNKEAIMKDYKLAGIGFALLLAPLYFVSASHLKYGLGIGLLFDPLEALLSLSQRREVFNLVSPFVFLGGLGLALALNAYAVLGLSVGKEDGAIVSTVRLRMKVPNIAVAVVSFLLLFVLMVYAFLENFAPR
jgi:hypothetical protein